MALAKPGDDSHSGSTRLIAPDEPHPALAENSGAASPFLLIGDHAGRAIPRALGDLGLEENDLTRHIAWDIGVGGLGRRLSAALSAPFIAQRYSRLVIDCNRDPNRTDAIPEVSDGSAVPGNAGLSDLDRSVRIAEVFAPYHARVAAELDAREARGLPTLVVALHSFTPTMNGIARPWRFGVLHLHDSPYSMRVLAALRAERGLGPVGDNEPYRMDGTDYTIPHHAIGRRLDYAELEVRQDLLADEAGQAEVAALLARVLTAAFSSN